jgi:hypothetical protein
MCSLEHPKTIEFDECCQWRSVIKKLQAVVDAPHNGEVTQRRSYKMHIFEQCIKRAHDSWPNSL